MDGAPKFLEIFLNYGAVGAVAIISLWFAYHKDRQLTKERERHNAEMREMQDHYNAKTAALEERYVTKAESWVNKYQELAEGQSDTIKALKAAFVDDK